MRSLIFVLALAVLGGCAKYLTPNEIRAEAQDICDEREEKYMGIPKSSCLQSEYERILYENRQKFPESERKSKWIFVGCPDEVLKEHPHSFVSCSALRKETCDPAMESCT